MTISNSEGDIYNDVYDESNEDGKKMGKVK